MLGMSLGKWGGSCTESFEVTTLPASPGHCTAPGSFEQKVASWTAWSCHYHYDSAVGEKAWEVN